MTEGRASVAAEHERQRRVRRENIVALEGSLTATAALHTKEIERQVAAERAALAADEATFDILQARVALFCFSLLCAPDRDATRHLSSGPPV